MNKVLIFIQSVTYANVISNMYKGL